MTELEQKLSAMGKERDALQARVKELEAENKRMSIVIWEVVSLKDTGHTLVALAEMAVDILEGMTRAKGDLR